MYLFINLHSPRDHLWKRSSYKQWPFHLDVTVMCNVATVIQRVSDVPMTRDSAEVVAVGRPQSW